jgi:tRNA1(Val) A37 N6-methylase TrmN6
MTEPDRLLGGRVVLVQPEAGYRAAIDPVFLAAATAAGAGDRVLDLGTGVGAAALCLALRVPDVRVVGLELQPALAALARANVAANGVEDRVTVVEGDVADPRGVMRTGGYDWVMANPPYLRAGAHSVPPDPSKAMANAEGPAGLEAWIGCAARLVRPRGWFSLIHRADRLDEILALLRGRFGAIAVQPLWPRAGTPAGRVVVTARRGARTPMSLGPGLVVHDADGRYSPEADRILRDGAALSAVINWR